MTLNVSIKFSISLFLPALIGVGVSPQKTTVIDAAQNVADCFHTVYTIITYIYRIYIGASHVCE